MENHRYLCIVPRDSAQLVTCPGVESGPVFSLIKNFDFMTTLHKLIEQRDALNVQIAAMQQAQRAEALAEIRATMREYQISVEDLGLTGKPVREPKVKGAPKYRDPVTQQTWSGRGKRPQWIHDALAAGKSLADLAI